MSRVLTYLQKQYTGQSTENFRGRWNNFKSKSKSFKRGEKCIQELLYKLFESEAHAEFLDDVSIALIYKTDGSNPTERELLDAASPQNICALRP